MKSSSEGGFKLVETYAGDYPDNAPADYDSAGPGRYLPNLPILRCLRSLPSLISQDTLLTRLTPGGFPINPFQPRPLTQSQITGSVPPLPLHPGQSPGLSPEYLSQLPLGPSSSFESFPFNRWYNGRDRIELFASGYSFQAYGGSQTSATNPPSQAELRDLALHLHKVDRVLALRQRLSTSAKPDNPVSSGGTTDRYYPSTLFSNPVQPSHISAEVNDPLNLLKQFDTVFLLDNSRFMSEPGSDEERSRWEELAHGLTDIVDIICRYNKDGVRVKFPCSDHRVTRGARIRAYLLQDKEIDWYAGGLDYRLWQILSGYIKDYSKNQQKPKMLNLIVITDGSEAAIEKDMSQRFITRTARELDENCAPPNQVGIHFLPISENGDGPGWPETLDWSLNEERGVRDVSRTGLFLLV